MTVIHANDPTTQFLSLLYSQREDLKAHITEKNTNMEVIRAIRDDDTIMMLGRQDRIFRTGFTKYFRPVFGIIARGRKFITLFHVILVRDLSIMK